MGEASHKRKKDRPDACPTKKMTRPAPGADALRWGSAFALAVSVLAAASVGVELFPFWDMDPGRHWIPSTGFSPAQTLVLSTIPMFAAAGALLAAAVSGRRVLWGRALLGATGSVGVIVHGLTRGPVGLEHLVHAAPWVGAMGAWVAATQLSVWPGFRRLLLAVVAGFVVALLSKGAFQVFVEHPMTVADFEHNRQAILDSRGWTPGSPNALAYERRLSQAEATGWFGLSNVYASFAAAGLAGLAAACVAGWRDRRGARLGVVACGVGASAAAAALVLSGSKGGVGASGVALVVVGGLAALSRVRPGLEGRVAPWVGPALIAAVLGLVAARGLVGEAIGERSVLFRAFYAVGALRIWGDHPLLGVGPAGFQDAYASAKPAISPETVKSPHSVLLDWAATLGVFGLAWAAVMVWSARDLCGSAVSAVCARNEAPHGRNGRATQDECARADRSDVRFVVLLVAAVTLVSLFVERALTTPEAATARLVGAAGWMAVSIGVHRLLCVNGGRNGGRNGPMRWFGAASGLALLAHAQIEVTPVWVNSAMLFGLWIGASAGPPENAPRPVRAASWPPHISRISIVGWAALPVLVLGIAWPRVSKWEIRLEEAATVMRPVAESHTDLQRLIAGDAGVSAERLARRVSAMLGRRVPGRPGDLAIGIDLLRASRLSAASGVLLEAAEARPGHEGTRSAAGKLLLEEALRLSDMDPSRAVARAAQAVDLAAAGARGTPGSVGAWDWMGVTSERAAELAERIQGNGSGAGARAARWRESAWQAWIECDRLSPHAIRPAVRLMDLAARVGRAGQAPAWAQEALRRDTLTRLDPLVGLTEAERERAERIAGGG